MIAGAAVPGGTIEAAVAAAAESQKAAPVGPAERTAPAATSRVGSSSARAAIEIEIRAFQAEVPWRALAGW